MKRSEFFALSFVVLVGVLLRYPRFPNEFTGDTLELHFYTDAIRQAGFVGFIMSPLSWFGLYPVSYPLGVPIMGAAIGYLTGMPSDDALAMAGIVTGIAGTFGSFALGHRLTGSFSAGLLCAAAFATSGYHISQSIAGVSGRAVIMALMPATVLVIALGVSGRLTQPHTSRVSIAVALVLINIALLATHRLFLFVALTEGIVLVGLLVYRTVLNVVPERLRRPGPVGGAILLLSAGAILLGALDLNIGPRSGPVFLTEFLNANDRQMFVLGYLIEQAYNVGPLVPLAIFGTYAATTARYSWSSMLGVLIVTFSVELFMAIPAFTIVVLSPLFGVVIGIGWDRLKAARKTKGSPLALGAGAVIASVVALSLILPGYFIYETQRANRSPDGTSFYTDQESVESGVFLHWDAASGAFITPDLTDSRRVMADGHIATVSSETTLFIENPGLRDNITVVNRLEGVSQTNPRFLVDLIEALVESKSPYTAQDWVIPGGGYGLGGHWGLVTELEPSSAKILKAYGVDHVLVNNNRAVFPLHSLVRGNYYAEYSNWLETTYVLQFSGDCIVGVRGCV